MHLLICGADVKQLQYLRPDHVSVAPPLQWRRSPEILDLSPRLTFIFATHWSNTWSWILIQEKRQPLVPYQDWCHDRSMNGGTKKTFRHLSRIEMSETSNKNTWTRKYISHKTQEIIQGHKTLKIDIELSFSRDTKGRKPNFFLETPLHLFSRDNLKGVNSTGKICSNVCGRHRKGHAFLPSIYSLSASRTFKSCFTSGTIHLTGLL